MLIAIEGLDQSGKATQAQLLRDQLRQGGTRARLVSFPDYGTSIGEEIARALQGERGSYKLAAPIQDLGIPDSVHALLASRIDRLIEREKVTALSGSSPSAPPTGRCRKSSPR